MPIPAASPGPLHIRFFGLSALVFLCGALAPLKLNLLGEIYAAELALPLVALAALSAPRGTAVFRERLFSVLLVALLITFCGYVLSDLVRETRPEQYLRGWGRVGLVIFNFVALSVVFGQDKRNLWWLALGMGVGGVLFLRLALHTPLAVWKFGYAEPVLLAAAALGAFLPLKLAAVSLVALGLNSMWFDFRSFAAICFLLGAYLWVRSARPAQPLASRGRALKLWLVAGLAGTLIVGSLVSTGDGAQLRREESNAGREAAVEAGLYAVARSPLIGYGSWTENQELAQYYLKRYLELRGIKDPNARIGAQFSPHSQILHAWVEGGILGAVFFFVLLYQGLRTLPWAALSRPVDPLTPLLLYFLIAMLWNVFMSPFSAPHRIPIAIGAAMLVALRMEHRASGARAPAQPRNAAHPGAPAVPRRYSGAQRAASAPSTR